MDEGRAGVIPRWVVVTAVAVLGGLVAGPLVLGAVLQWRSDRGEGGREARLQSLVDADYTARATVVDEQADATARHLRPALGRPAYRSRAVWCVLSSQDAGFSVQGYVHECHVRTLDVYPAPGQVVTERRLDALADDGLLGFAPDEPDRDCGLLRTGTTQLHLTWRAAGAAPLDRNGTPCVDPPELAFDPAATGDTGSRMEAVRVDRRFAGAPDHDRAWVYAERSDTFSLVDLGCAGVLMCGMPVSGAVLPRY